MAGSTDYDDASSLLPAVPAELELPLRSTSAKRVVYFISSFLMSSCLLLQALPTLVAGVGGLAAAFGMGLFTAVLASCTVLSAYLAHGAYVIKFSAHQESDFTLLLLGVVTPSILLLARWNPLPSSDDTRANCLITFAFLLRLGALMDLPPGHSMVQFVISYPVLTFLDYHRRCHQPLRYPDTCAFCTGCEAGGSAQEGACSHCCSPGSAMHHLCSRGLFTLAVGVVALAVPMMIGIKKAWEARSLKASAEPVMPPSRPSASNVSVLSISESCSRSVAFPRLRPMDVPFESLGLRIVSSLGLVPSMQRLEQRLEDVAQMVDESVLVSLVCIPVGLFYLGFALLARVMPKSFSSDMITSDEWLLAMSVFFVLGRESCSMDMVPYIQLIRTKLQVSQNILRDVLPEHVVNLLILANGDEDHLVEPDPLAPAHTSKADSVGALSTPASNAQSLIDSISSMAVRGLQAGSDLLRCATGSDVFHRASTDYQRAASSDFQSSSSAPPAHVLTKPARIATVSAAARSPAAATAAAAPQRGRTSSSGSAGGGSASTGVAASVARTLNLAENHECITVFMSDICGFSSWAHELPPEQVMATLNTLYSRLDDIILQEFPSLYKVETVGDAYVVAGNLVCYDQNHAATTLRFAVRAQQEAARVPRPDMKDGTPIQLRIGLHSGPAVSGIVGKLRRRFCMFGETVDLAMRTETTCPPGCIHLSAATHKLVADVMSKEILFRDRGEVEVEGLTRTIHMYLAVSKGLLTRTRMLTAAGVEL